MRKRIFQITLALIIAALALSNSLTQVSAIETIDNSNTQTGQQSWNLQIEISNDQNVTLTLDDLHAIPKTTVYADLSCYGQLVKTGTWGGVSLRVLLQKAGYYAPTANLEFYATDGYKTPFSFSDTTPDNVIVAYELDGNPLNETLRLVVPGANGEVWISMITKIAINNPVDQNSANPDAASISESKNVQQSSAPQPSPTPELSAQPTIQPTLPTQANQPAQQQDPSNPSLQTEDAYQILPGVIIAAAIAITAVLGYYFVKRKK